jgi:hypothetical protein
MCYKHINSRTNTPLIWGLPSEQKSTLNITNTQINGKLYVFHHVDSEQRRILYYFICGIMTLMWLFAFMALPPQCRVDPIGLHPPLYQLWLSLPKSLQGSTKGKLPGKFPTTFQVSYLCFSQTEIGIIRGQNEMSWKSQLTSLPSKGTPFLYRMRWKYWHVKSPFFFV